MSQILKYLQDRWFFTSNSQLKSLQDNLLCRIEGQDQELAKGGEDEVTMLPILFGIVFGLKSTDLIYLSQF